MSRRPKPQLLPFPRSHGGRRPGAGRRPKGDRAGVPHRERQALASRFPVHVTLKLRPGLPRLRRKAERKALLAAFAAGCTGCASAPGFRLCHFAILNDHLHFVAEARTRESLARALQGLLIRIAKALNRLWRRRGTVFADRYHDRILRTPREVRNAIRYVLQNGRKHAAEGRHVTVPQPIDTFTSAPWFDGFRESFAVRGIEAIVRPVADPRTWMLRAGWRRHGLLSAHDLPAAAASAGS